MTDLHALIRRMADELDHHRMLLCDDRTDRHPLATEARAALAEPQPMRRVYINNPAQIAECGGPCAEGGPEACDCGALWRDEPALAELQGEGPTDEELDAMERQHWEETGVETEYGQREELFNNRTFARAVLARWGRPAPPPAAAAGEVGELVEWLRSLDWASVWFEEGSPEQRKLLRAADLLTHLAMQPVPVSERLPGPEDTTDRNECWYWHPGEECWEMMPVVTGTWDEWSHWLPAHALPLPTPSEND